MEEQIAKNDEYSQKVSFLKRYFMIIVNLVDDLTERYSDSFVSASNLSGMPKSKTINTIDDIYLQLVRQRHNIDNRVSNLYNKKKLIERAVNNISDINARYVIKSKYLKFQTFETIANNLDKSTKQISRWHSDGIKQLVLPNEYKIKSS